MKTLVIIPARGGSKSIPGKNIKMLGDYPLIVHTIKAALKSNKVDEIIVTTDSEEIIDVVETHCELQTYILKRDGTDADDKTPVIPDVMNNTLKAFPYTSDFDIVLVLEPTYPFRNSLTIDRVIKKIKESDSDYVVTISKSKEHPHRTRKVLGNRIEPFLNGVNVFAQRQDLPDSYVMRGAVYVAKINNVINRKDIENMNWEGILISDKQAIDIDEPLDFILAKGVIEYENK